MEGMHKLFVKDSNEIGKKSQKMDVKVNIIYSGKEIMAGIY